MIFSIQQLIALFPLLILMLTAIVVMLFISYDRNHFITFLCTSFSFLSVFIFLFIINKIVPINITILFHMDRYSLLYIAIILFSSFLTCFFSYFALKKYTCNREEFYLLLLFSTIGCISLILSNHLFSFFIGIELVSLSSIGLISYTFLQKKSLESAVKYMILSGVVSTFLLLGIALIYSVSGNCEFSSIIYELVKMMRSCNFNIILFFGLSLVITACSFKLSIFPFHIWTPDVYQGISSETLIFFSSAIKIAIFSVIFKIFIILSSFHIEFFNFLLGIMSCLSIFVGNIMAINQVSIKRLLGYSSISQFGYLFFTLIMSHNLQLSLETTSIYLISYALSNIGVFGVMSVFSNLYPNCNVDSISSYRSLFWYNPVLSIIMIIMMLSLSGIPMTIGFIGKFFLISLIVKEQWWCYGLVIIIGSIIGLYAYLRIISCLLIIPSEDSFEKDVGIFFKSIDGKCLLGLLLIISLLILIIGIFPQIVIDLVKLSQPQW